MFIISVLYCCCQEGAGTSRAATTTTPAGGGRRNSADFDDGIDEYFGGSDRKAAMASGDMYSGGSCSWQIIADTYTIQ